MWGLPDLERSIYSTDYDAALDGAPVVALTGLTFHDLIGTRFIQSLNTPALMQHVALYNEQVTGPAHALIVGNRAGNVERLNFVYRDEASKRFARPKFPGMDVREPQRQRGPATSEGSLHADDHRTVRAV